MVLGKRMRMDGEACSRVTRQRTQGKARLYPTRKRNIPRPITGNTVMVYKKHAYEELTISHAATTNLFGRSYSLQNLTTQGRGDIVDRFKQYKIKQIICKFRALTYPGAYGQYNGEPTIITPGVVNTHATAVTTYPFYVYQSFNSYPKLWVAVDYTSANASNSLNDMKDFAGVKCMILTTDKWSVFKFSPRVQPELYNTVVASGYASAEGPIWVDSTSASVPHYGLKMGVDIGSENPQLELKIGIDYEFIIEAKQAI
jgi:hypothetical protein